jgi:hypothetical protein
MAPTQLIKKKYIVWCLEVDQASLFKTLNECNFVELVYCLEPVFATPSL